MATAEIISSEVGNSASGYDALNLCWLVSSLLVIRGFSGQICPAVSAYSWNLIAGHQKQTSRMFRQQLAKEGVENAVFKPGHALPPFKGGLLDFQLSVLAVNEPSKHQFNSTEASWIAEHLPLFNQLASNDQRFRFALEASVDWRYAKDPRAAISRLWAGIESLFGISSELVYRLSLFGSIGLAKRGKERVKAFRRIKAAYGVRSKAVHGEALEPTKLHAGMVEAFEILRTLLLFCVLRGSVPSEDELYGELLA